ncbi:MAG TPA: PIN domain-containing protein [Candidatus Deferrimicrobium sp.]|nr:PIN domain-containing protein [Candidatus Kapabacteria bacterium]HLP60266.1 PIN domain-containing protein [Candidatus Deferrimicrobium sp.]
MLIVDANIILRYLLFDNIETAKKAAEIIENNKIFLPFEVIAEVVYVLEKVYKIERAEISHSLKELFNGENIHTYDSNVLNKALNIFSSRKIDFVDTLLCGYSLVRDDEVITFDKKINSYILKEKKAKDAPENNS